MLSSTDTKSSAAGCFLCGFFGTRPRTVFMGLEAHPLERVESVTKRLVPETVLVDIERDPIQFTFRGLVVGMVGLRLGLFRYYQRALR